MIRIITLSLVLMLLAIAEGAQQIPPSFSHLSKIDAGEEKGYIAIYFDAKTSKTLKKQMIEPTSESEGAFRLLETRIDSSKEDVYVIDYSDGPSADPHFYIYRKIHNNFIKVGSFSGTELIIPGEGAIYVSGEANDFFNKRRKYILQEGILKEVGQPYYYVGLKTINNQPIDLYSDKNHQDRVAHLPANTHIEVLLASKKNEYGYDYLIKSPYGLVGWTTVEGQNGMCGMESIRGICFHGD